MPIFKQFNNELLKDIMGVSYVGKPKNNTMMYMSKKIESKLLGLTNVNNCLVFIEDNISVPDNMVNKHNYVLCTDPAASYTEVAMILYEKIEEANRKKKYSITSKGYYIGEDVIIGEKAYIEPGVLVDHGVKIGDNVIIKTGAKIRSNTVIGNNCSIGENTVVGEPAFNMTTLPSGKVMPVPSFGGVIIHDNVYIGANTSVSKGGAGDTIIEDEVKIDSNIRVGHDVQLGYGVELLGSCAISGYCIIGCKTVVAVNATIKNRTIIGSDCYIGMGSVVHHDIRKGLTVTGSPAMSMEKIAQKKVLEIELKEMVREYKKGNEIVKNKIGGID